MQRAHSKPFETLVGHNRDSREHLVTFGTTVGDCLLLKMLKKTCDSKYRFVEFRKFFDYFENKQV
jgi:hypothetical protein